MKQIETNREYMDQDFAGEKKNSKATTGFGLINSLRKMYLLLVKNMYVDNEDIRLLAFWYIYS